ncbi:hypothetical protein VNO77_04602 [Canavalia gladiata]|uniref:Uncharacterized protein n=1 Tax=Canavalia gladiata TaxID=3824 RepID=A0AAN9MXG2_CANGL
MVKEIELCLALLELRMHYSYISHLRHNWRPLTETLACFLDDGVLPMHIRTMEDTLVASTVSIWLPNFDKKIGDKKKVWPTKTVSFAT